MWVDAWQLECCGTPLSLDDDVSWSVRDPDREWLSNVLGSEEAAGIAAAEDHHDDPEALVEPLTGAVTGISTVHCRFGPQPGTNGRGPLYPVSGSGVRAPVATADGRDRADDDRTLVGYLVRLAVPDEG